MSMIYTSDIRAKTSGLSGDRLPHLRRLLEAHKGERPLRILGAHSGLSGLIAENAKKDGKQFDGLWSSSLTASASKGKPDIECVSTGERLALVQETLEVTTLPMIYDGNSATSTVGG